MKGSGSALAIRDGRLTFKILALALAIASSASSRAVTTSSSVDCLADGFRSALAGNPADHAGDPVMKIVFSKSEIHSAKDLSREIDSVREHAVPNQTYARSHPEKADVDIVKVGNLDHAYLAIFNHSTYMNWSLGRVTTFQTQSRVISGRELTQSNALVQGFGGHDVPASVSQSFQKAFIKEMPSGNARSPKMQVEWDFWTKVMLPLLEKDPKATLIAGAIDYNPEKVFSHELIHAHYYEKPELQKKVDQFWNKEVSDTDKKAYLKVLKREKYDLANHEQVMNEFLAFTLEEGKGDVFPESLIDKYRTRLRDYLQASQMEIPR